MSQLHDEEKPATLEIRRAVRPWVKSATARIAIGVSGGADSMALAIGTILEAREAQIEVIAVIVDHSLQAGSAQVAQSAADQLLTHGVSRTIIKKVEVELVDGMEASARRARYAAFEEAIAEIAPDYFFLAHTENDQAESVLLGLARGSGTKSLSGMAEINGLYVRPLLGVTRSITELVCQENGIQAWADPHNQDRSYARVRVRLDLLPALEADLGPGITAALARSAKILRQDSDALDGYAQAFLTERNPNDLSVEELAELAQAVRIRVLRAAIFQAGAPLGSLSADHLAPVEALVTDWHGQGAISLPGGVKVRRISGRLSLLQQK